MRTQQKEEVVVQQVATEEVGAEPAALVDRVLMGVTWAVVMVT